MTTLLDLLAARAWAEPLARALLHFLWQGALLGLGAAAVLGALRRGTPRTRHAVAYGFLLAMAAAPLATFLLLGASPGGAAPDAGAALPVLPGPLPAPSRSPWIVALWLAGVLLGLLRLAGGFWRVQAYLRAPWEPLDAFWAWRLRRHAAALGLRGPVEVRVASGLALPMAARFLRPVVWLPAALFGALNPLHIDALLAHELAHVARRDWLLNALQGVIESLLFYHPAVWWLSRRIRREREHACDDLAVALCGDAIALAEALAALEGLRPTTPRKAPGLVPSLELGASGGSLMDRIRRLLAPDPPVLPPLRAGLVLLLAAGAAAALPAARAFSDPAQAPAPKAAPKPGTAGARPAPSLAPGDTWTVSENDRGVRRSYRSWRDADGKVQARYTVNGQEQPLDAEGRRWLEQVQARAADQERRARDHEARARDLERQAREHEVQAEALDVKAQEQQRAADAAERQARALELQARALALRSDALSRRAEASRPDEDRLEAQAARMAEQAARMEAQARRLEEQAEKLGREMASLQAEAAERALEAAEAEADRVEEAFQEETPTPPPPPAPPALPGRPAPPYGPRATPRPTPRPSPAPRALPSGAVPEGVRGGIRDGVAGGIAGATPRAALAPTPPPPPRPPKAPRAPRAAAPAPPPPPPPGVPAPPPPPPPPPPPGD